MRALRPIALIVLASSCSSQPERMVNAPAAVARGQAVANTQTSSPAERPDAGAPASDADLLREGYHPAMHRGQRMYCRADSVTGSRFSEKTCLTAEQIRQQERAAKDILGTVRPDATCAQMKCN
jgi:hypothetical protein